jgi:prevent-host-death family protein
MDMKNISIAKDIIPIGEFKSSISKWINKTKNTGQPVVITQNGRPAAVMITPNDFDDLQQSKYFFESVSRGIADAEAGNIHNTNQLISELENRRKIREKIKTGVD